jgi:hypothetical protein
VKLAIYNDVQKKMNKQFMLKYLGHYEDVAREINVPNLSEVRNKLKRANVEESMIEDVLESVYTRDMKIIESAYLLGASDREQMLE